MEDESREMQTETEDSRVKKKKRKRRAGSLGASEPSEESEVEVEVKHVVGIRVVLQVDGIFKDRHEVAKFVGKKLGEVKSVRIARSGIVVVECMSEEQKEAAIRRLKWFNGCDVECFELGKKAKSTGVITGVPLSMEVEAFLELEGVSQVRRLKRYRDGEKEDSLSVCITFNGDLPERIYCEYVTYKVRPFDRGPLRCYRCHAYGHAAAVCRGAIRCRRCGVEGCDDGCLEREPTCFQCKGEHFAGARQCPVRKREETVNRIRGKGISYAEAVKRVEGEGKEGAAGKRETKREENTISMDKGHFLAFIAMVINCAIEMKGKTERIRMILDAARRFLKIEDISGEDLDKLLREGFMPTQAVGPGSD